MPLIKPYKWIQNTKKHKILAITSITKPGAVMIHALSSFGEIKAWLHSLE